MVTQESKKRSDLEKRLKLLRQQVYGRQGSSDTINATTLPKGKVNTTLTTDLQSLRSDLFKILIFSAIAIATQVILLLSLKNHLLNLNFV